MGHGKIDMSPSFLLFLPVLFLSYGFVNNVEAHEETNNIHLLTGMILY